MILYLNGNPGDKHGYSIWLDPTWHYSDLNKVLTGSRQAQVEDGGDLNEIAKLMDDLHEKKVESISIDPISFDIHIMFEEGYSLKTFVADPTDDLTWFIRDGTNELKLQASPSGVDIIEDKPDPRIDEFRKWREAKRLNNEKYHCEIDVEEEKIDDIE